MSFVDLDGRVPVIVGYLIGAVVAAMIGAAITHLTVVQRPGESDECFNDRYWDEMTVNVLFAVVLSVGTTAIGGAVVAAQGVSLASMVATSVYSTAYGAFVGTAQGLAANLSHYQSGRSERVNPLHYMAAGATAGGLGAFFGMKGGMAVADGGRALGEVVGDAMIAAVGETAGWAAGILWSRTIPDFNKTKPSGHTIHDGYTCCSEH